LADSGMSHYTHPRKLRGREGIASA
jgi:hypothetical protein